MLHAMIAGAFILLEQFFFAQLLDGCAALVVLISLKTLSAGQKSWGFLYNWFAFS